MKTIKTQYDMSPLNQTTQSTVQKIFSKDSIKKMKLKEMKALLLEQH